MKLKEINKTPVARKSKATVLSLPNNEVQAAQLNTQILELTEKLQRYETIEQKYGELQIRFSDLQGSLAALSGEKDSLFLQLTQQETAQKLLRENNDDLRQANNQVPILQNDLQQLTTKYNEVNIENNSIATWGDGLTNSEIRKSLVNVGINSAKEFLESE